jgi:ribonuclease HI
LLDGDALQCSWLHRFAASVLGLSFELWTTIPPGRLKPGSKVNLAAPAAAPRLGSTKARSQSFAADSTLQTHSARALSGLSPQHPMCPATDIARDNKVIHNMTTTALPGLPGETTSLVFGSDDPAFATAARDFQTPLTISLAAHCASIHGGPTGRAAIIRDARRHDLVVASWAFGDSFPVAMLIAASDALRVLHRPHLIEFQSDYEYVVTSMASRVEAWEAGGWRKTNGKPLANVDQWKRLVAAAAPHDIEWRWVAKKAEEPMLALALEWARDICPRGSF